MKSGNVIELDDIKAYNIKNQGDLIVELTLEWYKPKQRLLVKTINLSQIEAITLV